MNRWPVIAAGIAALVVLGAVLSCVYTIYPTDQVLLTQLGAPKAVITEPGLHFKIRSSSTRTSCRASSSISKRRARR